jgi:penicillin amidase
VLLEVVPESALEQRALALVASWDLRNDPDSVGAAIFQVWYRRFLEQTLGDELGEELIDEYRVYTWVHGPLMAELVQSPADPLFDDTTTDTVETRVSIARRAFSDAMAWLARNHGEDPSAWTWGELHPALFVHRPIGQAGIPVLGRLFNGPSLPAPGDRYTVNAAWFADDPAQPFAANGGAGQRLIVDLADLDASLFAQNSGQVEHLFHHHRHDLSPSWSAGEYQPLLFTRGAVEAQAEKRLRLEPAIATDQPPG